MTDNSDPTLGNLLNQTVLEPLKHSFIGKETIIDLLGICLVAGENCFLFGPPGTAKSALINAMSNKIGCQSFTYLLTRFTEPNELFGPFDIRKLRDGDLVTNTEGMLPEADIVFLDELMNANSAILNSLLMALNERKFRRGRETRNLPTLSFIGASNHLPEDESLGALFDRFLVRVHCDNVDEHQLKSVLTAGWQLENNQSQNNEENAISIHDILSLQKLIYEIDLSNIRDDYEQIIHRLRRAGMEISDRRAVKCQRLIAASAVICNRAQAELSDLWVLRHIWDTREQESTLVHIVDESINTAVDAPSAHPQALRSTPPDPETLMREINELKKEIETKENATHQGIIQDRLQSIHERCQWIDEGDLRSQLLQQAQDLWKRLA